MINCFQVLLSNSTCAATKGSIIPPEWSAADCPRLPGALGRAVQVDPIKPTLNAPGTKRLKLKYVELLSSFAFNFNLRRYSMESVAPPPEYIELDHLKRFKVRQCKLKR